MPTFQDLYDEFKAEVLSDPDSRLNDFSAGSFLDAFAAVSATAARSVQRWILRQMRRAFVSDAEGDDLTYVVVDRYGDEMDRLDGESDSEYRDRVDDWLLGIGRGTPDAIQIYAEGIDGAVSAEVDEDAEEGATTVIITFDDEDHDEDDIRDEFFDGIDSWRAASDRVNLELESE